MSCGKRDWTPEELMAFEEEIKDLFLAKRIRCPIHLSRGNEQQLINIFREIEAEDWVFSTHRSHYHALLHGISPRWLRDEILAGRSMQIMSPEHNFFTSSIVGGVAPIALGVAMALRRRGLPQAVWVFMGDMAGESGIAYESMKYAARHNLFNITWVVEDNGLSTDSPTQELWGPRRYGLPYYRVYTYERGFPHVGCGEFVHF